MAVPVSGSKRRAQRLNSPLRSDRKYRTRPSADQCGLSSYQTPSVRGCHAPPVADTSNTRDVRASARSTAMNEIQRWSGENRDSKMFLDGSEATTRKEAPETAPS